VSNPEDLNAYNIRGTAYGEKGQFDKAIFDFSKAIELNPRNAEVYYNRAFAYFKKQEYDEAWNDVYKAQNLGFKVHPGFLKDLREASGREK
jgi:tetratricopeptide (TPR) repeat protein